jgi:nicotinamidase/pyrazinamidase
MKAAFFCVDAQNDFMTPETARLYVPGSGEIRPRITDLTLLAMKRDIPVIASQDTHGHNDPEFKSFPEHCIGLTVGAELIPEACLLGTSIGKPPRNIPDVIITKQTYDVFSNPLTAKIVKAINAKQWFVYGVATDYCVRATVLGLRKMGCKVTVVKDAITGVSKDTTDKAYAEMRAAGVNFVSSDYVESVIA